jgi:hypothetical protein
MSLEVYILAAVFILVASLIPLQRFFARGFGDNFVTSSGDPTLTANLLYALIVFLFFVLFYYFIPQSSDKKNKENFFFEVSKNNPKCRGAFYGKPTTFQFETVGNNCYTGAPMCGHGMIRDCLLCNVYGKGQYPFMDPSSNTDISPEKINQPRNLKNANRIEDFPGTTIL